MKKHLPHNSPPPNHKPCGCRPARRSTLRAHLLAAGLGLALVPAVLGQIPATLTDIGAAPPPPGVDDAYQITTGAGNPDGLNYYFDNALPPGQTFTTGSEPNGYVLTTLALATAGNSGGLPVSGQAYTLYIYSVSGSNAVLIASYVSQTGFLFTDLDWLQWSGLNLALAPGAQYAYTFHRNTAGWENLANVSGNLYTGGEVCLVPTGGGGMTFGASHSYDAAFDVGLNIAVSLLVNPPTISPQSAVTAGTSATLNAMAVGPGLLHYQWQTDAGSGGALTNIPGANGSSLLVDTTGRLPGGYNYDVVVTNSSGAVTSAVVTLGISYPPAAATLTDAGGTISSGPYDISQLVGGGNGDGLNYYDDNGATHGGNYTGQTFTTGTNSQGYYLTSIAIQTGGGGSSGTTTAQPYDLFIYSVSGNSALLLAHYTNGSFSFIFGDWLVWGGFSLPLKSNSTYAYTFGRSPAGVGWAALNTSPTNTDLYPGGQICLVPSNGGPLTYGATGSSDAVFDVGLLPIGVGPSPLPFANPISVRPSAIAAVGQVLTLAESTTNGTPPLHYQWLTDGGSGTLTNIPSTDVTNIVVDTTGWNPGVYRYQVVVRNTFGYSTSAVANVTLVYANTTATLTDIGASIATPVATDISQLNVPAGANSPDGLNYYFDNATPPGQTFTTGPNAGGYVLTSLAIDLAGNSGQLPANGQPYILRLYRVSGSAATLYAIYTSQTNFVIGPTHWVRWSDLAVPLAANATYAYSFARTSAGSGWGNLANVSANPYAAGEVALVPANGGAMTFGASHDYDATFVIGLAMPGYPYVGPTILSPTNYVYAGTPITASAPVTGTGPFTYHWQTDGGAGVLTNIPGAINPTLAIDTTALGGLTVAYALVVNNAFGSTTSEPAMLNVAGANVPFVLTDITPAAARAFPGGTVSFRATFDGTFPMTYQWQVDNGSGYTNIPGRTATTLLLTNIQVSDAGNYVLYATNAIGWAATSPGQLTVYPQPTGPFTANFQWHSTEGGDAGNYTGSGIPGFGTGTYWNQLMGPATWNPNTFTSDPGYADDGTTLIGITWTLTTGGSWGWGLNPANSIPLLDSAASAYGTQPFSFTLPSGSYHLVVFSCNGSESSTANAGAVITINGLTRTALPTQNISFVEGNNYVVFSNIWVAAAALNGTWGPVAGKSYGSLNGFQLRYLGTVNRTPTNITARVSGSQLTLSWPADHLGWWLLAQTNHLSQGVSSIPTDWERVAGSQNTNQVVLPIDSAKPAAFYRLVYP